MNLQEIQAWLANETGVHVVIRTVKRYLCQLNLKILQNNVADGRVTMEKVFAAIRDAQTRMLQNDAGYQRMRMILVRQYDIRIPQLVSLFPFPSCVHKLWTHTFFF
jgi:hypothetical protein